MINTIKYNLSNWGCDVEIALNRFLNDENLYLGCLKMLIADETFEKLGESIRNNDISIAFDCSHTLKGVISNLEITPMLKIVVEILEPLRRGESQGLSNKYDLLIDSRDILKRIVYSKE